MRRYRLAFLGLVLLLPGCAGTGDFLADVHTYGVNPNGPVGNSENMRRARGQESTLEPLLPEPGDVWPGPVSAPPTLQDLERNGFQPPSNGQPFEPDHREPRPRGSSTPPGDVQPGLPPPPQPGPPPAISSAPPPRGPGGRSVQTPTTSGVTSGGGSGYQTLTTPQGPAVVVPNGNGTSTVIHSDGRVETIQSPH